VAVSEVKGPRLSLVANYTSTVWVCATVCIKVTVLAEEAAAVTHVKARLLVAHIALELFNHWFVRLGAVSLRVSFPSVTRVPVLFS